MKGSRTLGVLDSRAEGCDGYGRVEIVDLEFFLVEPVYKILQGFSPLLFHCKELSVGLRAVEESNELADKLLTELPEIPNSSRLQRMKPLSGRASEGSGERQAEQFISISRQGHLGFVGPDRKSVV